MVREFLKSAYATFSNFVHGDEYERTTRQFLKAALTPADNDACRKLARKMNVIERERGLKVNDYGY